MIITVTASFILILAISSFTFGLIIGVLISKPHIH